MDIDINEGFQGDKVKLKDLPCLAYHESYEGLRLISEFNYGNSNYSVFRLSGPNKGTSVATSTLGGYRKAGPLTVTLKGE